MGVAVWARRTEIYININVGGIGLNSPGLLKKVLMAWLIFPAISVKVLLMSGIKGVEVNGINPLTDRVA